MWGFVIQRYIIREFDIRHIDIRQWLEDIWEVFLFDYTKRTTKKLASREKLIEMASKQDVAILSIISSLGINPKKGSPYFEKLGIMPFSGDRFTQFFQT